MLGKRLVKALLNEKNLLILTEVGIDESDLKDDGLIAFKWVKEYLHRTGTWPTASMLMESLSIALPDSSLTKDGDEPLAYIADIVRKRSLGIRIERQVRQVAEKLESRDPDGALAAILECSIKLRSRSTASKPVSYRESGEERIKSYDSLKTVGGYLGVSTPWPTLNLGIQAWINGGLHVITAMQNTGKSWACCILGNDCLVKGRKVLLVTLEMPVKLIQRRLDAVRHKIPFIYLRDVSMDETLEERWRSLLRADTSGDGDILLVDKKMVRYVSDVTNLVLEHKPDIVIIDGGYRFEGRSSKSHWESTVNIVGELQTAAEFTDIPWLVTTQQGDANEDGKERKKGPKMRAWNVRYGKEWVLNPDVVIGFYQNEDLRLMRQMQIHLLKVRESAEGLPQEFLISWDRDTMDFSELDPPKFGRKLGEVSKTHEVEF